MAARACPCRTGAPFEGGKGARILIFPVPGRNGQPEHPMRFIDQHIDVPRLGSFGTLRDDNWCGTATPASEPVRQAMREARRGLVLRPAESVEVARAELETYIIHPAFYEGPAALLAAEYLQGVLQSSPQIGPFKGFNLLQA